jgi:PAS domain S-box-containing protein
VNQAPTRRDGRVPLLERHLAMTPEPASAATARHLLRDALADANRLEWADAGELAVSEIVTNAALHAHTDIQLRVDVYDDEVCIEVEDRNPALPIRREYDHEATTGRGLDLVAAVATACGVESLGSGGKVVWACLGADEETAGELDADALLEVWAVDHDDDDGAEPAGSTPVLLRSMPINLWLSGREHHDAILRELVLYLAERPELTADIEGADRARAVVSGALVRELERIHGAGHPSRLPWVVNEIDLSISVPADAVRCFGVLQDVLDLAESLAVRGELFIRPALPEIVAVRDWACEQVIAQVAGAPSAPWGGTDREHFETAVHERVDDPAPEWDDAMVADAAVAVAAADDANRIIAVSQPLASLAGWEVGELVGRRVVTLVPPRFREAHVAGFSRFLSSGEARILGMPLDLPLLTKDGAEITCRFRIELGPTSAGRTVYLAWVEPADAG